MSKTISGTLQISPISLMLLIKAWHLAHRGLSHRDSELRFVLLPSVPADAMFFGSKVNRFDDMDVDTIKGNL